MSTSYITITNTLSNQISLDGGDVRKVIPAEGTLALYVNEYMGNKVLCDQLSALLTSGYITIVRGTTSVTAADMTAFGYGADMTQSQYDTDNDEQVDAASALSATTLTEIDDSDSPYTVLSTDTLIVVDASGGAVQINLPAVASSTGRTLVVKDDGSAGTNNITIEGSGAETVDGALNMVLAVDYGSANLFCTGTEWLLYPRDADMAKIVYDTNDDGTVDSADLATLATTATSAGTAAKLTVTTTSIDHTDSPYTLLAADTDLMVNCGTSDVVVNLPAAASNTGRILYVKKISVANTVRLAANGAELIDLSNSYLDLDASLQSVRLISDGTRWYTTEGRVFTRTYVVSPADSQADETATALFTAEAAGVITSVTAQAGTGADTTEDATVDVLIGGVTCLTGVITLDNAAGTTAQAGVIDTTADDFAAGGAITFTYDWTTGGGTDTLAGVEITVSYVIN
jgi:hypothetical protein